MTQNPIMYSMNHTDTNAFKLLPNTINLIEISVNMKKNIDRYKSSNLLVIDSITLTRPPSPAYTVWGLAGGGYRQSKGNFVLITRAFFTAQLKRRKALQAVTAAPPAPAGRSEYQGSEQDGKHFCGNNPPLNIKKVCLPVKNYIRRKICLVTLALVKWIL